MSKVRMLILGVTGMLGHTLFLSFLEEHGFEVSGTVRNRSELGKWFTPRQQEHILSGVDADDFDSILRAAAAVKPDIVINCIGLVKQLSEADDPLRAIPLNALFPHRLALLCQASGARLIHFSTDCVFDGAKGGYTEADCSNALDLYGRTKFIGEIDYPGCLTVRTSIVGHELKGKHSLVEWFLAQSGEVWGFTRAIYSGFPTIEMFRIIRDYVIPHSEMRGVYHVSSEAISKYDLLQLVAARYDKKIAIKPNDNFVVDRSLNSEKFALTTGYQAPSWPELVTAMHDHYIESDWYKH